MAAARSASFTTTHRVVDRIHNYAADSRTSAQPANSTGLAEALVAVFQVSYNADNRAAFRIDKTDFAAGHLDCRNIAFNRDKLCACTRAAGNLRALAGLHFY